MVWVKAGAEDDFVEGELTEAGPALVVRLHGNLYAIENRCPHMECALSGGTLDGFILKCPCHDWKFDIRTGQFLDAPEIKVKTYGFMRKGGSVFIQ
jgi:nitrite reductase/ring-hydroxylating ferredoxin subunit